MRLDDELLILFWRETQKSAGCRISVLLVNEMNWTSPKASPDQKCRFFEDCKQPLNYADYLKGKHIKKKKKVERERAKRRFN
jgi:hypothetical protein